MAYGYLGTFGWFGVCRWVLSVMKLPPYQSGGVHVLKSHTHCEVNKVQYLSQSRPLILRIYSYTEWCLC